MLYAASPTIKVHLLSRNRDLRLGRKSNSVSTLLIREVASGRMNSDTVVLISTDDKSSVFF